MGPNHCREGWEGNLRWNPLVEKDFLKASRERQKFGTNDPWRGRCIFFCWTRKKGGSRESHGPVLGLECPNPLLCHNPSPCLSAALRWCTHSAIASLSSPVGNIHGRGWKTWCSSRQILFLLFLVGLVNFSLRVNTTGHFFSRKDCLCLAFVQWHSYLTPPGIKDICSAYIVIYMYVCLEGIHAQPYMYLL